jgi:hypothetical protein
MLKQGWAGFPRAKRVRLMAGSVNPGKFAEFRESADELHACARSLPPI